MTLGLAAKFKGGTLYATDSALTTGGTRQTMTHGKWFDDQDYIYMYAGSLWVAQELAHGDGPIRQRLKDLREDNKDDDDDDDNANLVSVCRSDGSITFWEYTGASVDCGDFGGCGSGGDLGLGLLELVYTPDRSQKWLLDWFQRIFDIVQKRDTQVYGPMRWGVVECNSAKDTK